MSEQASSGSAPAPVESAPASAAEGSQETVASQESQGGSPENQLQEAIESGDQKEANRLVKKYSLKVRGKEIEREVDLSDDNFVKQQLQLAEMSKLSMQETAEIKKAYAKFMEDAKSNPWKLFEEMGMNPDDLAELRIQQRIEEMKKSPEQVEREKIQKELEEARLESRKLKEEKEQMEMTKLQEQAMNSLTSEIEKAISGHKTLPNSSYVQRKVADSMLWAMNNGFPDVNADDVIPLVEKDIRDEFSKFMDVMPEEMMEQYIGKKNIDRLRKRRISQANQVPSLNEVKPTTQAVKVAQESKQTAAQKREAAKDFFRNLGKK
jgi:hypothetical protein